MASNKPKTPWGKAYSARFKELKREWDKSKKVGGTVIRTWASAFQAMGAIARKHADSKHPNPIAARKGKKAKPSSKGKGAKPKPAKTAKPKKSPAKAKKPGRLFTLLKRAASKPAAGPAPRTELVVVKVAGGELVNESTDSATMRKDGSREVVSGGRWVPRAKTIGKARKLREALIGKGVRFSSITVLVDGRRHDRKRKGRARFAEGKLYLE